MVMDFPKEDGYSQAQNKSGTCDFNVLQVGIVCLMWRALGQEVLGSEMLTRPISRTLGSGHCGADLQEAGQATWETEVSWHP